MFYEKIKATKAAAPVDSALPAPPGKQWPSPAAAALYQFLPAGHGKPAGFKRHRHGGNGPHRAAGGRRAGGCRGGVKGRGLAGTESGSNGYLLQPSNTVHCGGTPLLFFV